MSHHRPTASRDMKGRLTNGNGSLPIFSPIDEEKVHTYHRRSRPWLIPVGIPIGSNREVRLILPNVGRFHQLSMARFGRKRGSIVLLLGLLTLVFTVFTLAKRIASHGKQWPMRSPQDPPTLVFKREDLQRIWKWEVESGHYPSREPIPDLIALTSPPRNPSLPPVNYAAPQSRPKSPSPFVTDTIAEGPRRVYLDLQSRPPNVAYPPRPVPGSVADMDIIMKHCDFSAQKYVRDCLEVLRFGGGLDNENRLRRGDLDDWKYIYQEIHDTNQTVTPNPPFLPPKVAQPFKGDFAKDPQAGLTKKKGVPLESDVVLPPIVKHHSSPNQPCDPESPRLFHMFWTGPFTDKPYNAILSFLFTQNLGLNLEHFPEDSPVCRPQFWLWVNPGPAASVPNPTAIRDMFDGLKSNPWAAPFLHPRFKDVISFKLWNTTEQLDGVPEVKNEWRVLQDGLFNSGGHVYSVQKPKSPPAEETTSLSDPDANATDGGNSADASASSTDEDDMLNRAGTTSDSTYDRLSVILSDLARFVLCHRFGGIYLDADTIFLRDWEELWGWKGAFAYRWSRLEKYNTAVLRLNKGSALGTFLFKTALKNGLDFHPMTVSSYTKDAYLEGLLLRLPDALFDSAWLNTEYYQRDRPPQPYLTEFSQFFDTPKVDGAAPQALGFNGFFKGAYSYHFHNFWWKPFDESRNWPDLGPRFEAGEKALRANATLTHTDGPTPIVGADGQTIAPKTKKEKPKYEVFGDGEDHRDLDWATVLKRTFESYIRGERPNMYGEWLHFYS